MFFQIIDSLTKIISILNNGEKYSSASNRKKIGKRLLELHLLLTRIVENAGAIKLHLASLKKELTSGKPPYFRNLIVVLGDQRQLLQSLKKSLGSCMQLIDIYGDKYLQELIPLVDGKSSLIDLITSFSLYHAENFGWKPHTATFHRPFKQCLPRSFDLNDIEVFRNDLLSGRSLDFQMSLSLSHKNYQEIVDKFAVSVGEDTDRDIEIVGLLLSQIESMDAVRRLEEAKNAVADILKSHFKIEELF